MRMPMRRSSSGSSMRSSRSASARMSAPALMCDPSVTARVRTCGMLPSALHAFPVADCCARADVAPQSLRARAHLHHAAISQATSKTRGLHIISPEHDVCGTSLFLHLFVELRTPRPGKASGTAQLAVLFRVCKKPIARASNAEVLSLSVSVRPRRLSRAMSSASASASSPHCAQSGWWGDCIPGVCETKKGLTKLRRD